MVRFPYIPISWAHYACKNLIIKVETCRHDECIGVIGISYQRFSFQTKQRKLQHLLKLTCIHHCNSQATSWYGRTQRNKWSTFQRLAVTPADKFVQKWHRTRNETLPKKPTIEKSIFRTILTTKCSIFHWQSTIMASIATYWVLVPTILEGTRFPANSRFSHFIFRKNREIKYSRNMAHDFSFFAKLRENIKGTIQKFVWVIRLTSSK